MPFSFTNKSAGDLIRSQDWNAAMAAIAALYDKLNGTTGHGHTGGPEDGPRITTAGLADAAVTLLKLADLAVSTVKLQDNAVTNQKIAPNAVGNAQIANLAVNNGKIADLSVTSNKLANSAVGTNQLANASVTAAKLAAGAVAEYGFAFASLQDGQTAPVPGGFIRSECVYHWGLKYVLINMEYSGSMNINTNVNPATGVVTIGQWSIFSETFTPSTLDLYGAIHVVTIAKKGGW
jgi:hypothetical protein